MESEKIKTARKRKKRAMRVRKKLKGTPARPRLCVFKSNQHIFAQVIDDEASHTMASASTITMGLKGKSKSISKQVGQKIAELALQKDIKEVIFDRGRGKYHGALAEFANAAREAGLQF